MMSWLQFGILAALVLLLEYYHQLRATQILAQLFEIRKKLDLNG